MPRFHASLLRFKAIRLPPSRWSESASVHGRFSYWTLAIAGRDSSSAVGHSPAVADSANRNLLRDSSPLDHRLALFCCASRGDNRP